MEILVAHLLVTIALKEGFNEMVFLCLFFPYLKLKLLDSILYIRSNMESIQVINSGYGKFLVKSGAGWMELVNTFWKYRLKGKFAFHLK